MVTGKLNQFDIPPIVGQCVCYCVAVGAFLALHFLPI